MNRKDFMEMLDQKVLILDGAMGSNLYAVGMTADVCAEQWMIEHRDLVIQLQKQYLNAGSDIIYAPTFSCNRVNLKHHNLDAELERICGDLIKISKEAVMQWNLEQKEAKKQKRNILIAGDMTMTGEALEPFGDMEYSELVDIYKEQTAAMLKEGIDLIVVETMMSLEECEAAVEAIRSLSDIPICVSLTFQTEEKTLYGADAKESVKRLQKLGADIVGANCSSGPKEISATLLKMQEVTTLPLLAKPNAGMPHVVDGKTVYPMKPEEFASYAKQLIDRGARMIGGCCGTTPDHLAALTKEVQNYL